MLAADECSTTNAISGCNAGNYCFANAAAGNYCTTCGTIYPNSITTDNNTQSDCFMTCPTISIDHGTWAPDNQKIYYNNTPTCTYTNVAHIVCDANYHLEADECVFNTTSCPITNGTGEKYWNTTTSSWGTTCYVVNCDNWNVPTGYHKGTSETCISNTQNCTSVNLTNANAAATTIWTGSAWNSGTYDYTTCYKIVQYGAEHGDGSEKCYWTSGTNGNDVYTTNCGYTMISCISGYWCDLCDVETSSTPIDCQPTEPGYYSEGDGVYETACPMGMTSNPIATSSTDCFYKGGSTGTKFCDSWGCFHLPSSINIGH